MNIFGKNAEINMKKAKNWLWLALILFLTVGMSACKALDCGCPMH